MSDRIQEAIEAAATVTVSTKRELTAYKEGAQLRGYEFGITDEEADRMFRSPCHYCGYLPANRFNGIDRVINKVGYISGNVVPCCKWCNRAKGRQPAADFVAWLTWIKTGACPKIPEIGSGAKWEDHVIDGEPVQVAIVYKAGEDWKSPVERKRARQYVREKVWGNGIARFSER